MGLNLEDLSPELQQRIIDASPELQAEIAAVIAKYKPLLLTKAEDLWKTILQQQEMEYEVNPKQLAIVQATRLYVKGEMSEEDYAQVLHGEK